MMEQLEVTRDIEKEEQYHTYMETPSISESDVKSKIIWTYWIVTRIIFFTGAVIWPVVTISLTVGYKLTPTPYFLIGLVVLEACRQVVDVMLFVLYKINTHDAGARCYLSTYEYRFYVHISDVLSGLYLAFIAMNMWIMARILLLGGPLDQTTTNVTLSLGVNSTNISLPFQSVTCAAPAPFLNDIPAMVRALGHHSYWVVGLFFMLSLPVYVVILALAWFEQFKNGIGRFYTQRKRRKKRKQDEAYQNLQPLDEVDEELEEVLNDFEALGRLEVEEVAEEIDANRNALEMLEETDSQDQDPSDEEDQDAEEKRRNRKKKRNKERNKKKKKKRKNKVEEEVEAVEALEAEEEAAVQAVIEEVLLPIDVVLDIPDAGASKRE